MPRVLGQGPRPYPPAFFSLSLSLFFFFFLLSILPLEPAAAASAAGAGAGAGSTGAGSAVDDEFRAVPHRVTLSFLRRTLQALEDALRFFHSQHTRVNLDGVIGTRVVEGTLKVLLTNLRERGQLELLPHDVAEDIRSVHDLAKRVSDEAEPFVAINEPVYFDRIWPTIHGGMWELNYRTRNLSTSVPTWPMGDVEYMEEKESDDCLTELFGTSGKTNESCLISSWCWEQMTKLGYNLYSLTHQIFYLQLGESWGCLGEIWRKLGNYSQPGLGYLQDLFCANILKEARILVQQGYPVNRRDLFMEQAGLCGMYGYWEFFRYSWLEKMLSWQNQEAGCYQNSNWPTYLNEGSRRRKKREELRLDNGCLSHMTTVAASALVNYVRYLSEALLHNLDHLGVHQLYWQ